jgi:hypothetical protein
MKTITIHVPKFEKYRLIKHKYGHTSNKIPWAGKKEYSNWLKRCEDAIAKMDVIDLKEFQEDVKIEFKYGHDFISECYIGSSQKTFYMSKHFASCFFRSNKIINKSINHRRSRTNESQYEWNWGGYEVFKLKPSSIKQIKHKHLICKEENLAMSLGVKFIDKVELYVASEKKLATPNNAAKFYAKVSVLQRNADHNTLKSTAYRHVWIDFKKEQLVPFNGDKKQPPLDCVNIPEVFKILRAKISS